MNGYTGTNFNRPDFQKMIKDIENGKINMVVTKDLSRLGRDYIATGEYMEKWFPENNVRYVSVTDGIDTFSINNGNNDIAPFKAILNDMYSKDLSKKIKTALHTMQAQGKWVGGKTPLGYKQDPDNKNHLIICEEEAKIVKTIFNMAIAGNRIGSIRDYLNDNKIPTTNELRYNKATYWSNKTIKNILRNEIYTGVTIQNKRSRISYKNRKIRENPKEEWIIVENTHTQIIDKKIFDSVQKMIIVQQYSRNEKKNYTLLDGLMFCYECGHRIGLKKETKNENIFTICNYYRKNSKLHLCTCHGFNYYQIEKRVLDSIKELFLDIDNKKIELNIKNKRTIYDYKKLLEKKEKEIEIINNKIDNAYFDKLDNKIDNEMYQRITEKLKMEIEEKKKEYIELNNKEKEIKEDNTKDIEKIVKEFLSLAEPTPEFMKVIIGNIKIHQDKQIDIIFNFKELNKF